MEGADRRPLRKEKKEEESPPPPEKKEKKAIHFYPPQLLSNVFCPWVETKK
jgi:hypothetical protein